MKPLFPFGQPLLTMIFALICVGGSLFSEGSIPDTGLKVGDVVPLFRVQDLQYKNFIMADEAKRVKDSGKLMVFDFFAMWCVPCKKEFPIFEKIYKELGEKGVEFYAVSIDSGNPQDLWKFIKTEMAVTFPILKDPNAFAMASKFGATKVLPQLFIVDGDRVVKFKHIGEIKNLEAVLKAEIERLKPGSFPEYKGVKAVQGETAVKAEEK